MKRGIALVLALLLLTATPALAAFSDVPEDAWYLPAVTYMETTGIMKGVSGGRFDPDGIVNRGMLAEVLNRAAGSPHSLSGLYFLDVEVGTWYIDSIIWCAEHGIVTGVDETHFCPTQSVTREQAALMIWRLAGWPAATGNVPFADADAISSWAAGGVNWAYSAHIISGKPGNLFDPQGTATRAEIAQMLMNYRRWKTDQP